jgi:Fe-S metabolism associated domain
MGFLHVLSTIVPAVVLLQCCSTNHAFLVRPSVAIHPSSLSQHQVSSSTSILRSGAADGGGATGSIAAGSSLGQDVVADDGDDPLGLTPELKRVTDAFAAIQDEQVRYKQLLYMAQNTKEANSLPESSKIPRNKVPGCLSTVYVDGSAEYDERVGDYVINFLGDSDGLLTKGLVALLVR